MLLVVTFALVGLAVHALVPPHSIRRKTLGFGPDLPHARFESPAESTAFNATKGTSAVAHDFLSQYDDYQAGRTYVIRPDSYTDHATGVTHVYARQIIGGIEVANAHANLNIKDGRVLSFGDSFFPAERGRHSNPQVPVHPHAFYCAQLSSVLDAQRSLPRSPLASRDRARVTHELVDLEHLHLSNCVNVPSLEDPTEVDMDPRRPLLAFLASALPEDHPDLSTLGDRIEEHASNIVMTPETHLLGDHASLGMSLSNVPGAVSDVKARIVWIQVLTEHGVELELAHRFEVEMEHNWYETTVTTSMPHHIVSVVDWVSDSPMPVPVVKASGPVWGTGRKAVSGKKDIPHTPKLNKASYLVFPWGTNDPVDAALKKAAKLGNPAGAEYPLAYGREIVKELGDTHASPLGWHTLPFSHDPSVGEGEQASFAKEGSSRWRTTKTTWGNNVFAHENWAGGSDWMYNERPLAHADGSFSYHYSPEPANTAHGSMEQARRYINASVAQLFYTSNMVHDLFYRYGFTESAGNFQQYNFERGGEEGDAVIADAQDGYIFNNAVFASPPDGQHGRCRMGLWDTNSPYADGSMAADIVIHELSHGLSSRLTGGPKNAGCLGWGESGGMGEGWGDLIAITVRSTSTYSDYAVATWASNTEKGVRQYPYSTDSSVNPLTYKMLDTSGLHAIGEAWAEMLWVIQQRLIAKHGFSDTLFPPVPDADGGLPPNDFYRPQTYNLVTGLPNPLVPRHGNTLLLQLVINGMKMQPCSPSFFEARDAIIQADEVLTGGENVCDIWQGFAERGLGVDAAVSRKKRTNGFKVPSRCRSGELGREPTSNPEDRAPCSLWNSFVKWILRLPLGYKYNY